MKGTPTNLAEAIKNGAPDMSDLERSVLKAHIVDFLNNMFASSFLEVEGEEAGKALLTIHSRVTKKEAA